MFLSPFASSYISSKNVTKPSATSSNTPSPKPLDNPMPNPINSQTLIPSGSIPGGSSGRPNSSLSLWGAACAASVMTHPLFNLARCVGTGAKYSVTPKSLCLEGVYGLMELGAIHELKTIRNPYTASAATWVATTAIGTVIDPLLAYGVTEKNMKKIAFSSHKIVPGIAIRQGLFTLFAKAEDFTTTPIQRYTLEGVASLGSSYATYLGFKGHPDFKPRTFQQLLAFSVLRYVGVKAYLFPLDYFSK